MFKDANLGEVDQALREASVAFLSYKNLPGKKKGEFLRAIAHEIESLGNELVTTAMNETALPEARIVAERGRTSGHLRMFAALVEEGSWVEARIDTAIPDRVPAPKPDIRKMRVPLGLVVVFGASNFPLAYSTAGGDTASALAAGCPVIVKAHPAHAKTSQLVADAISKAMTSTGMPRGVFQHLHGSSFAVGQALVTHTLTKAVGFTGSFAGGKALYDLAVQRKEPVPVFAEMGSVNPVILLPESLQKDFAATAEKLAASITLGVGQFCTNPGLVFAIEGAGLNNLIKELALRIRKVAPATMLHPGISSNYRGKLQHALGQRGVLLEAESETEGTDLQGRPAVASVPAVEFLKNPGLAEEVFGPFSLVVKCASASELSQVVGALKGQLTATVIGSTEEISRHSAMMNILIEKAGRLIINGVPTGVEVCPSMQHGGPFPATTDSRFSSVGTDAIYRFTRPVSFQGFPDELLPAELKNSNPLGIWRLVNGGWTK
jgi:NADP-dependent aldehyde dehydrogenase